MDELYDLRLVARCQGGRLVDAMSHPPECVVGGDLWRHGLLAATTSSSVVRKGSWSGIVRPTSRNTPSPTAVGAPSAARWATWMATATWTSCWAARSGSRIPTTCALPRASPGNSIGLPRIPPTTSPPPISMAMPALGWVRAVNVHGSMTNRRQNPLQISSTLAGVLAAPSFRPPLVRAMTMRHSGTTMQTLLCRPLA